MSPSSEDGASADLGADERAHREAQVVRDRLAAGAPDADPVTREALDLLTRELTALAQSRD